MMWPWYDDLASALGAAHVLTDPQVVAGYAIDWTGRFRGSSPAVVRPGSTAEVADVIAIARSHGLALVPQGGNTGLVGGGVPLQAEVVLRLDRLAGEVDVNAAAGTATAGAGVTIAALQAAARAAGWEYGVDWAARDSATVGGSIATNAGGLKVVAHGSTRQQILGLEAVWGDGTVLRDLPRLEKDATGYDLSGLLCGSEGTLGVVTAARLRLVPHRPDRALAALGFSSMADAVEAVGVLRRALPGLEAAEVYRAQEAELVARHLGRASALGPDVAVTVLVELAGHGDQVEMLGAAVASLEGVAEAIVAVDGPRRAALWGHREALTEAISTLGPPHKLDVSLPPEVLGDFADQVSSRVVQVAGQAKVWIFGHLGDGNLHVNVTGVAPDDESVDAVVLDLVLDLGGSISAEHGVGTAKRPWLLRQRGSAVSTMAAVKRALDPDAVMNPNVLL